MLVGLLEQGGYSATSTSGSKDLWFPILPKLEWNPNFISAFLIEIGMGTQIELMSNFEKVQILQLEKYELFEKAKSKPCISSKVVTLNWL